jgi:hypothetical protein
LTEAGADAGGPLPVDDEARGGRPAAAALFAATALVAAAAAVLFTWRRLFLGMDLQDESFSILVPWRWALGDTPFVDEENLAQVSGFISYPFVKLFAVVRDYDVTGLVLYTRHLYLLLMIAVAVAVCLMLRRSLRWELGLVVALVFVTFIYRETPQLSYNTMGAAFLTLGSALGLGVVLGGSNRAWAFASGVAYGLAVVAYPTLLFIVPFYAVFMALAMGRRSVGMVAEFAFAQPPDPDGPPTGHQAWRAISFWVLGGIAVLVPFGMFILSFGLGNLQRAWAYTMSIADELDQLGGADKAYGVAQGIIGFLWSRPYLVVAALLVYLVFTRWPRAGRVLLATLPAALWLAGQRTLLDSGGLVIVYVLLAPYLYLFIPRAKREAGARLLYWVWAPAVIAGAMTAFTGAAGYLNAPVGLLPGLMASGVFLAWSLEAVADPARREEPRAGRGASAGRRPWLALIVLIAVTAVTVAFQFQFQQRGIPYPSLTKRCDFGPWRGIAIPPERYRELKAFATDLDAESVPGDQLLVFFEACGYYLFWSGDIAANSYWLSSGDALAPLPQSTFAYYRRHQVVPTLVVHLLVTAGMTDAQLQEVCGGLDYPPILVRPRYAFYRTPAGESVDDVLSRLPRE